MVSTTPEVVRPSVVRASPGTRQDRRQVSWWVTLYGWTLAFTCVFFGAVAAVLFGGLAALLGDRHRRVAHFCVATAYRTIISSHLTYRWTLNGLENLPKGGFLLCPNHQSISDVAYLFGLPFPYRFVIKKELLRIPLFGAAIRMAGYPTIDRGDPASAQDLLDKVSKLLRVGIPVLTFPEGTRSSDGTPGRFHSGPARMAVANQVPVVPVGIHGTNRLLPRGILSCPPRGHVVIHLGRPISTKGLTQQDVRPLTRSIKRAVISAKARAADIAQTPRRQGLRDS